MKLRNYTLSILFIFILKISFSQKTVEPSLIKWYTIEEADSLSNIYPKPIMIDVYTDWCGWCKHMMKTTFAHKGISNYININFYPVRFNAEGFDTIKYQGKTYTNLGNGRKPKHDFAKYILNNRFSFPTIVYIDKKRKINPVPGYMKVHEIEPLLVYFVEEIHNALPYKSWKNMYQQNYPEVYEDELKKDTTTKKLDKSGIVKWFSVEEASSLCMKNDKPMLVYLYTDWCQSCKIEEGIVFKDSIIANLVNKNYYPVKFNAASQDTVFLFGQKIIPSGKGNPHKLTSSLLQESFKFPAFVFINSKKHKVNEVHGFISPYQSERIFSYIKEEKYRTQKFEDYVKSFIGKIPKD